MTTPNYKLKDDHVSTCGHVRQAYNLLDTAKLDKSGGVITGSIFQTDDTDPLNALVTKQYVDEGLSGKQDGGTITDKIQNATGQTAISCDTDRYISIKSMGTKLADILEDEQNQGMTILTNNKRFNLVSAQPQTFYHNSPASLYNFKYTDDGNLVNGQFRFGQIQLAPSNTTNLNPALTLISSRVNGLGNAGAIYLDSTYGIAPLIFSPQSLTDSGGNQFSMVRSTVDLPPGSLRNTFSAATGYADGVNVQNALQFTTKQYVDDFKATTLWDKNESDGAVYKVDIDNNRVNFYRGDGTDQYMEIFGSSNTLGGTVTQYAKRNQMRFAALGNDNQGRSEFVFSSGLELNQQAPYTTNGIFRIETGAANGQSYIQFNASKLQNNGQQDGENTSFIMYPRQEDNIITNHIQFRDGIGYTQDADFTGDQNDLSILCRIQNDQRYSLKDDVASGDRLISVDEPSVKVIAADSKIDLQVGDSSIFQFYNEDVLSILESKKDLLYIKTPLSNESSNVLISSDDINVPYAQLFSAKGSISNEQNVGMLCVEKSGQFQPNIMRIYTRDPFHQDNDGQSVSFECNRPIGYKDYSGPDFTAFTTDKSILPRGKNDDRYELKNQVNQLNAGDMKVSLLQSGAQVSASLRYTAGSSEKEFCRITQLEDTATQISTNQQLFLQNNSLAPEYQVDVRNGLNKLRLATFSDQQKAYIEFDQAKITFKPTDSNQIQLNTRIGYENGVLLPQANGDSLLTKDEIQALILAGGETQNAIQYAANIEATNDQQLPTKGYVDNLVETARNNVTQLVDANTGEDPVTNNYKLRIDNNQLEFYRGLNSDDVWLKFFGSTTTSSDAVVQQTNRSNYYFESTDDTSPLNSIWLRYASSVPQAIRDLEAPLRFQQGYDSTNNIPFCRISAVSQANFNNNTTILMYPSDERITFADKIVFNRRAGYQIGVESQGFSDTSILSRSENDNRYYVKTTPLNTITAPTDNVSMNNKKLTNLSDPTDNQDAATKSWTLSQISSGGSPQIISFKIRCGDVPFTSGTAGTVNVYTMNSTNFPLNQSNIVSQALWVRQSGRSDTIRFLITLNSAVTEGRPFIVQCQAQTTFVNSSGGPTSDWRFGDSTESYIVQTFDLRADISRFGLHIRDLGNATSQNLLLNCSVIF